MTHLSVREWGRVPVGEGGFTRSQADALLAAARAHPCSHEEGTNVLVDLHTKLSARQMVGVIAAEGCSLEILPKVDPELADEDAATVRSRLMRMLQMALGLDLSIGATADLARQGRRCSTSSSACSPTSFSAKYGADSRDATTGIKTISQRFGAGSMWLGNSRTMPSGPIDWRAASTNSTPIPRSYRSWRPQ